MADVTFSDTLGVYWDDAITVVLTPASPARVSQIVVEVADEATTVPVRATQIAVEVADRPNTVIPIRASKVAIEYANEPTVETPVRVTQLIVEIAYKRIQGGWRVYEVRRI